MKKLIGIVAVAFVAGVIGGGIDERVADEVWTSKTAHAAASPFGAENCMLLSKISLRDIAMVEWWSDRQTRWSRRGHVTTADVLIAEHC